MEPLPKFLERIAEIDRLRPKKLETSYDLRAPPIIALKYVLDLLMELKIPKSQHRPFAHLLAALDDANKGRQNQMLLVTTDKSERRGPYKDEQVPRKPPDEREDLCMASAAAQILIDEGVEHKEARIIAAQAFKTGTANELKVFMTAMRAGRRGAEAFDFYKKALAQLRERRPDVTARLAVEKMAKSRKQSR